MITVILLAVILVIALVSVLALLMWKVQEPERVEKARIEREMYKAEFRLHEMASETFSAFLDAARASGFKQPK